MDRIIILAAGLSSRFWPLALDSHKSFYKLGNGKTIIEETVLGLLDYAKEIDIVVSPKDLDNAKRIFNNSKIKIFVQENPDGEGDAVLQVFKTSKASGKFFLTTGDKINASKILETLGKQDQAIALRKTDNPSLYGIVELDSLQNILSVVEKPSKESAPSDYKIVSAYLLDGLFMDNLKKYKDHYSLELALNDYVKENRVKGVFIDDIEEISLKFPWDLLNINKIIQNRKDFKFIDKSALISKTAVIEGNVYVGENAKVMDFVKIKGPVFIGEGVIVGDHSLVRDNSFMDKNVVVGAGSEVKNSILYQGVHIHRTFVGDSVVDSNVRIGAGTVIANKRIDRTKVKSFVKGKKVLTNLDSFGAIIGANTKIGINSSIMPGVKIGKNAQIWPVSLVLKDVEDNAVFK